MASFLQKIGDGDSCLIRFVDIWLWRIPSYDQCILGIIGTNSEEVKQERVLVNCFMCMYVYGRLIYTFFRCIRHTEDTKKHWYYSVFLTFRELLENSIAPKAQRLSAHDQAQLIELLIHKDTELKETIKVIRKLLFFKNYVVHFLPWYMFFCSSFDCLKSSDEWIDS